MPDYLTINNIIMAVTVVFSVAAFRNTELLDKFTFRPVEIDKGKQYYRLLTSGFLHADYVHLFINMFVLNSFGKFVEAEFHYYNFDWGKTLYLVFYLSAIVVASLPSFFKQRHNDLYVGLGASGGVSAVVFAAILINPFEGQIYLFGIPQLALPSIAWGIFYLAYEYYGSRRGGDNINHDAHLWGALYGIAFLIGIHPRIIILFAYQFSHLHISETIQHYFHG